MRRRKTALTRPEMAAALLAEVAYENIADFAPHLPQLLHALVLLLDSPEPLVYQHAHQVRPVLLAHRACCSALHHCGWSAFHQGG